jgi:hypothetical protein
MQFKANICRSNFHKTPHLIVASFLYTGVRSLHTFELPNLDPSIGECRFFRNERTYRRERAPQTGIMLAPIVLISAISGEDAMARAFAKHP